MKRASVFYVGFAVLCCVFWGCNNREPTTESISASDQISAAEIHQTVLKQYTESTCYSDKAVLYLTYRLDGKAIREPHPWSVAWHRDREQFKADLFNSKIRNDGERLSCYVFDIESGNIDNQHLLVPNQGFTYLLDDPIASHFVFGTSELPLDEIEAKNSNQLIQPILGFYDPELMPPWLFDPGQVSLIDDDGTAGVECYVLKLESEQRTYCVWVGKSDGMIEQIQLPLQYLDSQILAADQVTDLRLFVRFHDAILNGEMTPEPFQIENRMAATNVRRFVALPEAAPSDRLGEVVKTFDLIGPGGRDFVLDSNAQTHVFLWVPEFNTNELLREYGLLCSEIGNDMADFVAVYSDDLLIEPGKQDPKPDFSQWLSAGKARGAFDSQLEFVYQLGIQSLPVVVVFNKSREIQYVKNLDQKEWHEEVGVAIRRIMAGEDLASEMKLEYQKFLDEYHQQLTAFSSVSPANNGPDSSDSEFLEDFVVWRNNKLIRPGNIHVPATNDRIVVFDGFQSIVEIDIDGDILNTEQLELPGNSGVNRIRSLATRSGEIFYAVFSMLGKQVFVFDQNWKSLMQLDAEQLTGGDERFTDCQLIQSDSGLEVLLSCSGKSGIVKMDATQQVVTILSGSQKGFYQSKECLFSIDGRGRFCVDGQVNQELRSWNFSVLKGSPNGNPICVGLAKNELGYQKVFCLNQTGEIWSQPIELQESANHIESLFTKWAEPEVVVGIASGDSIVLVDSAATQRWSYRQKTSEISGCSILDISNHRNLVVANGREVWNIRLDRKLGNIIPASVRRPR